MQHICEELLLSSFLPGGKNYFFRHVHSSFPPLGGALETFLPQILGQASLNKITYLDKTPTA